MKKGFLLSSSSSSSAKRGARKQVPAPTGTIDATASTTPPPMGTSTTSSPPTDISLSTAAPSAASTDPSSTGAPSAPSTDPLSTDTQLSHLNPSSLLKVVRMQNNDNNDATVNDHNDNDDDPPNEGTAVVSIQRQRRLDRMSVRRQKTNNYCLAKQHQHQLRQRQQFLQEQNREQHREARAEMTPVQLANRQEQDRDQHRIARAELTPEQLENRQEQDRDQHRRATAAEGVQRTNAVNGRGETFSLDMIGRPTADQLEGFEFNEDKALMLFYENSHDHVNDLIQELEDCEMGEGWRWKPLSKRCLCYGGPLACSMVSQEWTHTMRM